MSRGISFIHYSAGRFCSHVETALSASVAMECNSTLQEYLNTLNVRCEGDESEAAILTWTPDENTPDVVYYQVSNVYMMLIANVQCSHYAYSHVAIYSYMHCLQHS